MCSIIIKNAVQIEHINLDLAYRKIFSQSFQVLKLVDFKKHRQRNLIIIKGFNDHSFQSLFLVSMAIMVTSRFLTKMT